MQILIAEVKSWMYEAAKFIKVALAANNLVVCTKSDRTDLVTNIDKETQNLLIEKIKKFDPTAKVLGEENDQNHLTDLTGRVFIIDPIDGTMNFVLEQENFCIMIAVYENGQPSLGFVYDVMRDMFLWGGPSVGVYNNDCRVNPPLNKAVEEGLLGVNAGMYGTNYVHAREIGNLAMGVRMTGCAGVELIALILGKRIGYLSHLAPWDYAAGGVLLETLGLKMSNVRGEKLNLRDREFFVAGTPKAYDEMLEMLRKD